jgi:hypothetical protein
MSRNRAFSSRPSYEPNDECISTLDRFSARIPHTSNFLLHMAWLRLSRLTVAGVFLFATSIAFAQKDRRCSEYPIAHTAAGTQVRDGDSQSGLVGRRICESPAGSQDCLVRQDRSWMPNPSELKFDPITTDWTRLGSRCSAEIVTND